MTEEKDKTTILNERTNERTNEDIYSLTASCNDVIKDSILKADRIINDAKYEVVLVSISGGSDSDDILDICWHVDRNKKCKYIWFDTGLEYKATRQHLDYLENKYNIQIIREKPIIPIPLSCKEYGEPFVSKLVSSHIHVLQNRGFQFTDEPYEELVKKYSRCTDALKWWCNSRRLGDKDSWYDISRNRYLKEFMIANPPTFTISAKCCDYAKKKVSSKADLKYDADLEVTGVRKAEGGVRTLNAKYRTCFSEEKDVDTFRPIWWWSDSDKEEYEKCMGITHSDCYKVWGFIRTGCVGCPFNRKIEDDLLKVNRYEPNMYKAACNIFKNSYEYTKKYKEFAEDMRRKGIKPRKD